MNSRPPLHLFAAYGIEMEYMIVHSQTLKVMPIADQILQELNGGELTEEVELGDIGISNELVMHVIEFKCQRPIKDLGAMHGHFLSAQNRVQDLLKKHGAMLLPTAMHPMMYPDQDMKLWPHGNSEIYAAYNRIFDCRGHGWSNLQSVHINLPFANDEEFGRLHAAIRVVLPILPGLAASSPLVEGHLASSLDQRLEYYRNNQKRIPEITGHVIPERVFTKGDYETGILQRCYRAIAPQDPDELLREEWLNSRGAIARFDRNAIEIRLLDIQEAPIADFAIINLTIALIRALAAEHFAPLTSLKMSSELDLEVIFRNCTKLASQAQIHDQKYLQLFGYPGATGTARQLWQHLAAHIPASCFESQKFAAAQAAILTEGTLAERILARLPADPQLSDISALYTKIAGCLREDRPLLTATGHVSSKLP